MMSDTATAPGAPVTEKEAERICKECGPAIEEVREGCGFGSYSAAWKKIEALDRRGFLEKEPRKESGIRLS